MPSILRNPEVRLCMIVRNEGRVIGRCLDSVAPFLSSWCIVDTGSTDDTADRIKEHLKGIPGVLHFRPWVDFGNNRTEAVLLASDGFGGYFLVIDADEVLHGSIGPLLADVVSVEVKHPGGNFWRPTLLRASVPWFYTGRVHEELGPRGRSHARCTTASVLSFEDGGRHHGDWLDRDIAALAEDMKAAPTVRSCYHMGVMLVLKGQHEAANRCFLACIESGDPYWAELAANKVPGTGDTFHSACNGGATWRPSAI